MFIVQRLCVHACMTALVQGGIPKQIMTFIGGAEYGAFGMTAFIEKFPLDRSVLTDGASPSQFVHYVGT